MDRPDEPGITNPLPRASSSLSPDSGGLGAAAGHWKLQGWPAFPLSPSRRPVVAGCRPAWLLLLVGARMGEVKGESGAVLELGFSIFVVKLNL